MPINGPSASASYPCSHSYPAEPDGPSSSAIDARQDLPAHEMIVRCVDAYTGPASEPRHGMAVSRLLAVCACDLHAASMTESHLDAILFNILGRPPFLEVPREQIRSLVDFLKNGPYQQTPGSPLYARENREEIARIVLERDNRYYDVEEFLRTVPGEEDKSRESGFNLIQATYEYTLNAAILLAAPEQRDDISAKVELYRGMAGHIPAALIARSIDDPESTRLSGKHYDSPVKNYIEVWSALQCDLALALATPPTDQLLDLPPSVICFIERYSHALNQNCRHLEFAMGNANYLASKSHMEACCEMIDRLVSPQLTATVLGPSMHGLTTYAVPVTDEPMRSMITQLQDHRSQIVTRLGELMATDPEQPLEPTTWSGVSDMELAVANWRTDDYAPEKWRKDLLEPGAQEFARTLVELAKIPSERFGSLISPVFETLRKLIDNADLRKHAFKEAKAAFSPGQPVRTWIHIRQCVDVYEIHNGSHDIQIDMSGYRSRVRKPLMDIVEEDFRNFEKETCALDRLIPKCEDRADEREKEIDGCRRPALHKDFLAYAWRYSTLFTAFVRRMYQWKLPDAEVYRGLLDHGMSMAQINASQAEGRIPARLVQIAPQRPATGPAPGVHPVRQVPYVPSPLAFAGPQVAHVPSQFAVPAGRAAPKPSSTAHSSQSSTVTKPSGTAAHHRPPRKRPKPSQPNSAG